MPVDELSDPRRIHAPLIAGERQMLDAWLEFHRVTLLLKCEGLSDADRKRRPVASSLMSLHGLIRHMAEVELGWFQRCLDRRYPDPPPLYSSDDHPDGDFEPVDGAVWEDDLRSWEDACEQSRTTAARYGLDDNGIGWEGVGD